MLGKTISWLNLNIDLEKTWYSNSILSFLLLPLSWLFRTMVICRRAYYRLRNSARTAAEVFVVVVGNITVGGTGKTPFVIWLAQQCKDRGLRVGIVTRGYKRENEQQLVEVQPHSLPSEVGDEALLLALKTTCPVIAAADRKLAVEMLIEKYKIDLVLCDDGLQHYNLARDIEIAVVDGERKFGNGRCLPAGPLREPITRLSACDLVVSNGRNDAAKYYFEIEYNDVVSLTLDTVRKPLADFKDFTVHAVAGIGNPQRFFNLLKHVGVHIIEHSFPDHHAYQQADLEFSSNDPIIMTEKDAVKCKNIINKNIWYLPIVLSSNIVLDKKIETILEGVPHG